MYLGGAANCIPDTVGSTPVPRRMGAVDCIADTVCMTLEHAHVSKLYLGYSSQHPCHVAWGCCQLYPRYSLQHPVFLESTTPWFCLWCVNFNRSLHSAKVAKSSTPSNLGPWFCLWCVNLTSGRMPRAATARLSGWGPPCAFAGFP